MRYGVLLVPDENIRAMCRPGATCLRKVAYHIETRFIYSVLGISHASPTIIIRQSHEAQLGYAEILPLLFKYYFCFLQFIIRGPCSVIFGLLTLIRGVALLGKNAFKL